MHLFGVFEIDRIGGTDLFTDPAFALLEHDTVVLIDLILERHRLGVLDIDGLAFAGGRVVLAVHFLRTFGGALPARDTSFHIHIAWMFFYGYIEVACLT